MNSLQGIVPPLVTPLSSPDKMDSQSLAKLLDHVVKGGVAGVFILGTTGEGPSLTRQIKERLIVETCREINNRIPVIVGITDTSYRDSLSLAALAAENGAQAVVLSAPYYFPISQEDLLQYVQKLSKECPLPIFLYNMPSCTKTTFEIETLKHLAQIDSILGIKDSSGDMLYFKQVVGLKQIRPDWSVLIGPEQLIPEAIYCGGDGGVCGGANLFPELYVRLFNASVQRQWHIIEKLQKWVMDIAEYIYKPAYMSGLKCALSLNRLCLNILAEPLRPAGRDQQIRIQNYLSQFDLVKEISSVSNRKIMETDSPLKKIKAGFSKKPAVNSLL